MATKQCVLAVFLFSPPLILANLSSQHH